MRFGDSDNYNFRLVQMKEKYFCIRTKPNTGPQHTIHNIIQMVVSREITGTVRVNIFLFHFVPTEDGRLHRLVVSRLLVILPFPGRPMKTAAIPDTVYDLLLGRCLCKYLGIYLVKQYKELNFRDATLLFGCGDFDARQTDYV